MGQRLRVGLIGIGAVGLLHHKAYRAASEVEVVAVADTSEARLSGLGDCPAARYLDAREMLEREALDIACILTPASSHEMLTTLCASLGVNVLCEKPLALTADAARNMVAATKSAGVRLAYGSSYRFLPAVQKAREIIGAGAIGSIRLMREQAVGGHGASEVATLPLSHYPAGGPGGFAMGLADHGIHLIDVFGWFAGSKVTRITGRGNVSGEPLSAEYLNLEYETGAVGQIVYDEATFPTEMPADGAFSQGDGWDIDGFVSAGSWTKYPGTIHVFGTDGSLRILHYANQVYLVDKSGLKQIPVSGPVSPYHFAAQIDCFATDIKLGRPTSVPGDLGIEAIDALLSIYPQTGKLSAGFASARRSVQA
jgi:predicted dehydrogenase